jgi:preprotein translocase subunit SecY
MLGAIVAIIESLGLAIGLGKQGMFYNYSWYMVLYATAVWTAGACFLIWCGQFITNKLIGNGISLILMFNILTSLPGNIINIYNQFSYGQAIWVKIVTVATIILVFSLMYGYTVILSSAEKRLPVTNSSKSGIKMNGANSNDLPLKLNMGGVMPIIFSSSMMSVPIIIGQIFKVDANSVFGHIISCFNQGMWFHIEKPWYTIGVLIFIPLTFAFAYFYSMISFNPKDIADNLKKSGSVIKGIRPGDPTAEHLSKQARSMLWLGTSMLLLIALFPTVISGLFGISRLTFGGTTIIIIVGTILEMKNTIVAQTSSVAYKSLIKKRGVKK